MMKALAVIIGTVVFVAIWSSMFYNMSPDWSTHQRLARSGVQVTGAVTAKEPLNHASVRYDYYVDGTRYSGGPCSTPNFDHIRVGNPISVTYLPDSPSISVCGDAEAAYKTRSGILFIIAPSFALVGALGLGFGVYYRFMRGPRRNSSNQAQRTAGRSAF